MRSLEKDLPILHRRAREMFVLAEEALSSGFKIGHDDHFGFMAACYGGAQLEHARSVGILVDSDQYVDAAILCRVMLGGVIHLGWASLKPEERGLRWRAYGLVSDWKLLQLKRAKGEEIDSKMEEELKSRLRELGVPYLTKKARSTNDDAAYPDPYQSTWMVTENGSKFELNQMMEELGDLQLRELYNTLSQHIHWTPRGLAELMERHDRGIRFGRQPEELAAMSCAIALQMLGHTLEVLSSHFELEAGTKR